MRLPTTSFETFGLEQVRTVPQEGAGSSTERSCGVRESDYPVSLSKMASKPSCTYNRYWIPFPSSQS